MERIRGLMDKNRIGGAGDRGERAANREAPVANGAWRKSGSRAVKDSVIIRGDLASGLKGPRAHAHGARSQPRP